MPRLHGGRPVHHTFLAFPAASKNEKEGTNRVSIVGAFGGESNVMTEDYIDAIRESYNQLAEEYARHIFDELRHKPLDRELLSRFAAATAGRARYATWAVAPARSHVTCTIWELLSSAWIFLRT